jgi:hypothetical protein
MGNRPEGLIGKEKEERYMTLLLYVKLLLQAKAYICKYILCLFLSLAEVSSWPLCTSFVDNFTTLLISRLHNAE